MMRVASWRVITVTSFCVTFEPKEKPALAGAAAAAGLAPAESATSVVTMRPFAMSFWRACASSAASIRPVAWAPLRSMAVYL